MSQGTSQMMAGNGSGMINQMGGTVHYQSNDSVHHSSQISQQMSVNMGSNTNSLFQHMRNSQMMVNFF